MDRKGLRNTLLVGLMIVGVICIIIVLTWVLWHLMIGYIAPTTSGSKERKEVVEVMASVLGGVVAPLLGASFVFLGFYITRRTTEFAIRNSQLSAETTARNAQLAEAGRRADLFSRAIDQLGANDDDGRKTLEIRIGGIHTLERLAKLSAEEYEPVMGVLTAYVRVTAQQPHSSDESTEWSETVYLPQPEYPVDPDVQAALSVIGRISNTHQGEVHSPIDLSGTDLRNADLRGGGFEMANFQDTNLQDANLQYTNLKQSLLFRANLRESVLFQADLQEAKLARADLSGADLDSVNLSRADLYKTNLSQATLYRANLRGAHLRRADLNGADLREADLSGALGITNEELQQRAGSLEGAIMPDASKHP